MLMKRILLVITLAIFALSSCTDDEKLDKKLDKEAEEVENKMDEKIMDISTTPDSTEASDTTNSESNQ